MLIIFSAIKIVFFFCIKLSLYKKSLKQEIVHSTHTRHIDHPAPEGFHFYPRYLVGLYCTLIIGILIGCQEITPENNAPQIQSSPVETAELEVAYRYEVVASDKNADPLTYSLKEKPDGMIIDAVTGIITWKPTTIGIFNVTVSVDDNEEHITKQNYSITVARPSKPVDTSLHPSAVRAFDYLYEVMDQFHDSFNVYTDFARAGNHFTPSGWMGYRNGLTLNDIWTDTCYSGDSCIHLTYATGGENWAGIYWQSTKDNWGEQENAGFNITDATKLTFWAKGEQGGEKIAFYLGGIAGTYPDSIAKVYVEGCIQSGKDCFVTLTNGWKQYTINLDDKDLTHVVGGFAFVTNTENNPTGALFYIDEIKYNKKRLDEPRLLVSYDTFPSMTLNDPDLYLRTPAFIYDNALVALAFLSRGTPQDLQRAKLIVDAFVFAQNSDRTYIDGRLRNAYMGGDLADNMTMKARLPLWWNTAEENGEEDESQISTHIGNMAWAAMAILGHYEQVEESKYLDAAIKLAEWIEINTRSVKGHGGYTGGVSGRDESQEKISWKSTEQNIDVYIFFCWLERVTGDSRWKPLAAHAKGYVDSMWDELEGHFWTGTNDNEEINKTPIPIDSQVWAVLALNHYETALDWVTNNLSLTIDGFTGFDFNEDLDGIWFEGTAQMVTGLINYGKTELAEQYLKQLRTAQISATNSNGKGIVAASHDGVSTGFKDWSLISRLHIGATAWYLIAEMGTMPWNVPDRPIITSHPVSFSTFDLAIFEFSSTKTNGQHQCSLDGEEYIDCDSPMEFSSLTAGEHVFCVRNKELHLTRVSRPACFNWMIDLNPPMNTVQSKCTRSGSCKIDNANIVLLSPPGNTDSIRVLMAKRVERQLEHTNQPQKDG